MWQRKLKKRIKWTSNFPAQTLRNDAAGNFSVKLCLNVFKARVRAQNAEHPLLFHFESTWENLTSQSLSTTVTAPSYFTSSTSCELAVATNKIIHWLSYIGAAELQTKAQSTGLIYYWWTDVLAVHCAVNVETKQGTGLELVLLRMFLAVSIKYLVWNNNHARSDHWCEVSWWWKTTRRSMESNSEQNRLWWNQILMKN